MFQTPDSMYSERHYLTPLLEPASVAIVGASETANSIGAILARNMLDANYRGRLFFVNPRHRTIFGHPCHATLADIRPDPPQRIDLAAICTRAETVPEIVETCGHAGVRSIMIVSGGFSDGDLPNGATLRRKVQETAQRHRMHLIGPDCLGIVRPAAGIHLAFTRNHIDNGSIGLIAQSSALTNAILDWAHPNGIGFSCVASLGETGGIDTGDLLDFMVCDPRTRSIFLHIESIHDARRFMSALRAAARCKPVLLLKVGRHPAGAHATLLHHGQTAGADAVFEAAVRRTGAVRLDTVSQMHATAQALLAGFQPRGNRLAIVTNGGGPGAMAADHADGVGISLAGLSAETLKQLAQAHPAGATALQSARLDNPLDIGDNAGPDMYALAIQACAHDANVDGILAILTPQTLSDPSGTARATIEAARQSDKPLAACWMGEERVAEARTLLREAGIPCFRTPEPAVELFAHVGRYFRNQELLRQTPAALSGQAPPHLDRARHIVETALQAGHTTLDAAETQALLAAFHIPIARNEDTPPAAAMPPLRISVRRDTVFGPFIACGTGNETLEQSTPHSIALPPLNAFLAADLLHPAPDATRHRGHNERSPAHMAALETLLLRVSEMICELPWLREMDLDTQPYRPRDCGKNGATTIAARIAIGRPPHPGCARRYDHMAIHPYPAHLVTHYSPRGMPAVTIRPIRPEDAQIEQTFVRGLSAESRYFRFMNAIRELPPIQLARMTQIDYDREMALIAVVEENRNAVSSETEVGVARYAINPDGASCEFAIVVADAWQGSGLARQLMHALIAAAKDHGGIKTMNGEFLADNQRMLKFVGDLGFILSPHPEDTSLKYGILTLETPSIATVAAEI